MTPVRWIWLAAFTVFAAVVVGHSCWIRSVTAATAQPECCAYGDDPATLLCWECREEAAPKPADPGDAGILVPCNDRPGAATCLRMGPPGHWAGVVFRRARP